MNLKEALMKSGLTGHESDLYIELAKNTKLTGYEAAKLTGISRSNAYHALKGLVTKGAAYLSKGKKNLYIYVSCKEYIENKKRENKLIYKTICEKMPEKSGEETPFITIEGEKNVFDKIKNIVESTEKRIYISMESEYLQEIISELEYFNEHNKKVVLITDKRYRNVHTCYIKQRNKHEFRIISDSEIVLTGEIGKDEKSSAIYSKNKTLVKIIKDSLRNEIEIIKKEKADD